jgi:PAS domain S-box-containing protein
MKQKKQRLTKTGKQPTPAYKAATAEQKVKKQSGLQKKLSSKQTLKLEAEINKAQPFLDIASVIFIVLDNDQKIILINKKGVETLGYTDAQEILGLNWYDNFIAGDKRTDRVKYFRDIMSKKIAVKPNEENVIITKNGEERRISWRDSLLSSPDGKIIGLLCCGEDVTIQRENEEIIKVRTAELEMFNSSMLGREMRIIELKEEINALARETKREIPYPEIWED